MNLLAGQSSGGQIDLGSGLALALNVPAGPVTVGVRANALRLQPRPGDIALADEVELAEISGSDTFVHVRSTVGPLVAQLGGVHYFELGAPLTLHLAGAQTHVFDAQGLLLLAPHRDERGAR